MQARSQSPLSKKDIELGKDDFDFNDQDEKKNNEVSKFLQKLTDNLSPKESLDILYALKKLSLNDVKIIQRKF